MAISNFNPFPGLRSFDYEESHLFFGREKHINDLLQKLAQNHFVAIVGTSGSGKSSLVKAGLLPAIHNGKLSTDGTQWLITAMKPGNTPIKNLAASLLQKNIFGSDDISANEEKLQRIEKLLYGSSLGLVQSVRGLLTGNQKLLILLDQFEETFRFSEEGMERNNQESEEYVNLIIDAIRQRDVPIYVILTIRSDFLGDCARFEGLPEAINDGHYLVPRLNGVQNKFAITGPVKYADGKISPRLVQLVINELGDNPDQLPVLQHALMRTWDKWKETAEIGEPMDIRHYEMTGMMSNALSNHADEAFNELSGDKQKILIGKIFKSLTVKTGENRGVRRPTAIKHLTKITGASFEEVSEVLQPFRKNGRTFVLPSEEIQVTANSIMDISHESLMRAWERLKIWVDDEMESALVYERLSQSALLHKKHKAALWRDPELQVALDWREKQIPTDAWAQQYNSHFDIALNFLNASNQENLAEINQKKKRTNLLRGAVATFLIVVSILAAWAMLQTKEAKTQTILADKNRVEAEQKAQEAINQKQLAEKAKEMALEASKQAMDAKSYAELQSNIAGAQTKLAEEQKAKAEEEALRATKQQQLALQQKKLAEQKSAEALSEKEKAETAENEATRLRLLSLSQNIAFKSIQVKTDDQLSSLLANAAYKLTRDNKGNTNDPQLFSAAFNAASKIDKDFKDIKFREETDIITLNSNAAQLFNITQNGKVNYYGIKDLKKTNSIQLQNVTGNLNTAYLSAEGKFALIGKNDFKAVVYDLKSGGQGKQLTGQQGLIRTAAFSDDGNTIATGGRDSAVIVYKNYQQVRKLKFTSRIKALFFTNNKNNLLVGCDDGNVFLCDAASGDKNNFTSNKGNRVQAINVSESGKTIAVAYSNGAVQILNNKGELQRTVNETSSADYVTIDEAQDIIVVVTSRPLIHVYQLSNLQQKPIEITALNSPATGVSISSEFIYISCVDNTMRSYPYRTSYFEKIFSDKIKRSLTAEEWNTYIGKDVPYDKN